MWYLYQHACSTEDNPADFGDTLPLWHHQKVELFTVIEKYLDKYKLYISLKINSIQYYLESYDTFHIQQV